MFAAPTPTAAARINTPRPQSRRKVCPPARTNVEGPARLGSTMGLPAPRRMTSIMRPNVKPRGSGFSADGRNVAVAGGRGYGGIVAFAAARHLREIYVTVPLSGV